MEVAAFTYQSRQTGASMTLFTKEDIGSEDYSLLEERIAAFSSLYLAFTHRIHPKGHKESKDEIANRDNFYPENHVLIAAEFDNQGITGYASAFFVSKENPRLGYVMELTGFQVTDCVYGAWEVKDDEGDVFTMEEVLDYFGLPLHGVKNPVAPVKRNDPVAAPSFVPNKKRTIQNLGTAIRVIDDEEEDDEEGTQGPTIEVTRAKFVATSSKKPGRILLDSEIKTSKKSAKPVPIPVEEEEEDASPVEVERMDFVANSHKKPGQIHLASDRKKEKPVKPIVESPKAEAPVEVERMDFVANSSKKPTKIHLQSDKKPRKPIVEPKEETVRPPVSITPDFTPVKQGQPGQVSQTAYEAVEDLLFPIGPKNPNARLFIYFPDDEYVRGLFEEASRHLASRSCLSVKEDCLFALEVPQGEKWSEPLSAFDFSSWRILALTVDRDDTPITALLGHALIPGLAIILDEKGAVAGYSEEGIDIRRPHFSYAELLSSHGIAFPKGEQE